MGVSFCFIFYGILRKKKINSVIKIRGFVYCARNFIPLPDSLSDLAVNLYCCCELCANSDSDDKVDPSALPQQAIVHYVCLPWLENAF